MAFKNPEYDLSKSYTVFVETGLIIALSLLIIISKVPIPEYEPEITIPDIKEGPPLFLPPATNNAPTLVPPPPVPEVPVIIPNDSPLEPPELEFTEFDLITELEIMPLEEEVEVKINFELLEPYEVLPTIIGGENALRDQIEYPQIAIRNGIEGIVEVEFYVNKNGEVVDPVIIRGIGAGCDREVLKAIKKIKYKPGVKDGKPAEFKLRETVQFIIVDLYE